MSKQLVVYDTVTERLEGLDPARATGLPIPAFRSGAALPAVGQIAGEAFLNTTSRSAFVWTGAVWEPIVPSALLIYPTDADVLADATQPAGTYAASSATGNLFIMGNQGWRQSGVRTYPTAVGLLADSPPDGSLAIALDEHTFWLRSGGDWLCQSTRTLADPAAVVAWATSDNAEAFESTYGTTYLRASGQWYPRGTWAATEAQILANTALLDGQIAIATDTGRMWVRASGAWTGSPVQYMATEAALLASTPADGVIGVAGDTRMVFIRTAGAWLPIDSQNRPPVGEIIMYPSVTPPPGFLLCDGSPVDALQYPLLAALIGANLPDLRDVFVRGSSAQNQIDGFTQRQDTTRRPRSNFTGSTSQVGDHKHPVQVGGQNAVYYSANQSNIAFNDGGNTWTTQNMQKRDSPGYMYGAGAHSHTITINGGGDAETAPKHIRLAYMIRHS